MNQPVYLRELLEGWLPSTEIPNVVIHTLTNDSRQVTKNSLFIACPGVAGDGREHINDAIKRGAVVVLQHVETLQYQVHDREDVLLISLPNLRQKQGELASRFYENPSQAMTVIGVTGTNGKTSCTHFIAQALQFFQKTCGIMGTLGYGFLNQLHHTGLTTSDVVTVHQKLAELRQQGADVVAMEVSSHALDQHRVSGVLFDIAVFTQLSRDHLDYHHDMQSYAAAKTKLFYQPGLKMAVVNLDDDLGLQIAATRASDLQIVGYSLKGQSQVKLPQVYCKEIRSKANGFEVYLDTPWGEAVFETALYGEFNIYNLLAVFATLALMLQKTLAKEKICSAIAEAFRNIEPVSGRMQRFGGEKSPTVIVDYAHTPDALEKVLQALRLHCKGKLWCVFGCGGDRDSGKRPLMGRVAEQLSDVMILTNDNPRSEDPNAIVQDICAGILEKQNVCVQLDRSRAIHQAITSASACDMVLIAGKGHEDYQIIGKNKLHFSDAEQVQLNLQEKVL
jgi:UDP-N-acetylmuramoyl-L-alanyl-D-glutamate--2,6-diaminopimelate ligase